MDFFVCVCVIYGYVGGGEQKDGSSAHFSGPQGGC